MCIRHTSDVNICVSATHLSFLWVLQRPTTDGDVRQSPRDVIPGDLPLQGRFDVTGGHDVRYQQHGQTSQPQTRDAKDEDAPGLDHAPPPPRKDSIDGTEPASQRDADAPSGVSSTCPPHASWSSARRGVGTGSPRPDLNAPREDDADRLQGDRQISEDYDGRDGRTDPKTPSKNVRIGTIQIKSKKPQKKDSADTLKTDAPPPQKDVDTGIPQGDPPPPQKDVDTGIPQGAPHHPQKDVGTDTTQSDPHPLKMTSAQTTQSDPHHPQKQSTKGRRHILTPY